MRKLPCHSNMHGCSTHNICHQRLHGGCPSCVAVDAGGVAHVHILRADGLWRTQLMPLAADGQLYMPEPGVELQKCFRLSSEPLQPKQRQRGPWQRFEELVFAVQPNSHLYFKEKPGEDLGVFGYVTRSQFVLTLIIAA
jgi:hypothetical protein